jgi:hypothetical protein
MVQHQAVSGHSIACRGVIVQGVGSPLPGLGKKRSCTLAMSHTVSQGAFTFRSPFRFPVHLACDHVKYPAGIKLSRERRE